MKPNNQIMLFKNLFKVLAYSVCFTAFTAFVTGCSKNNTTPAANIVSFKDVSVSSAQETPANGSSATGVLNVDYDKNTKSLKYTITYSGLTPTAMHFHKAAVGVAGGVQQPIVGPYSSGMTGQITLTAAQEIDLLSNNWYINIHTTANPGGEIRGQVVPNTTVVLANVALSANQEAPVTNSSAATGMLNGLYDKSAKSLNYTLTYTGLTPIAMHFHKAAIGVAGSVVLPIASPYSSDMTGTATLTAAQETDLLANNWYINMHTTANPGGEIRGQIGGDNVVVFSNTLSGANEAPTPNNSTATGTVYALYNKSTKALMYVVTFTGLTPIAMHFHKGAAGVAGDVVQPIPAPYSSGMAGSVILTAAQETDLLSQLWYVNVHSANFPGGEIRAQLVK